MRGQLDKFHLLDKIQVSHTLNEWEMIPVWFQKVNIKLRESGLFTPDIEKKPSKSFNWWIYLTFFKNVYSHKLIRKTSSLQ